MGFFVNYLTVGGGIAYAAELKFAQPSTGSFAAAITGTGSVLKTGTGNLILSGSSTCTGATSVAAGRLSVDGILGDSPIAVLAAAELGGSGSIPGTARCSRSRISTTPQRPSWKTPRSSR